ncbi:Histone-lysine N-methyltransferase set-6 [Friedmanniomyces endolithicus]|nr:Histone-lysine N-methyltransferase set-6 [Friedmanniomyces endolithicus]KAK0768324.1 Histone-lysine N-methyltransferase set-6 [Friedmanniomyces endolithicus]KAK0771408.1 Histone-lysine N-methyltransferase set-6 [Friedmanniomyces endolithicus]
MSPPASDLLSVKTIPGAGRGIIANCEISKDTTVLNSEPPVAHVLFREYRKEVCAHCFLYDRGRTLRVKDHDTGKVFCSASCRQGWVDYTGEQGRSAWRDLYHLIHMKNKGGKGSSGISLTDHRPGIEEIDRRWEKAQRGADEYVRTRSDTSNALGDTGRKQAKGALASSIDPDILGYLLSGILHHDQQPDRWREAVMTLAMHDEPYSTTHDLEAHCNSFVQLCSIMPVSLLRSCTIEVCRALAAASSHNAFGIRSGGEDGEEYMGYGVYPSASYFNHSCHPNVAKQRVGNVWRFWVTEDVRQGDELCISYLGGYEKDLNVRQRRGHLQEVWGFVLHHPVFDLDASKAIADWQWSGPPVREAAMST